MKCKRALMGLAAVLILVFHFYIPFSKEIWEQTFYKAAYIGVDIFFLVSGISFSRGRESSYGDFMKNRIQTIYIPFVCFAVIAAIYKQWEILRFLKVISGIEFFERGGGSFLWFNVAILLLYAVTPLILKGKKRFGWIFLPAALFAIAGLDALLQFGFGYTNVFILLNRLPIFLLGLYYPDIREKCKGKGVLPGLIALLLLGGFMIFQWGGIKRLMVPVKDFYYVIAIPFTVALTGLLDFTTERTPIRFPVLSFIGGFTLELYCFQMIFGFDIETALFKATKNGPLSFLVTALILGIASWITATGKKVIMTKLKNKEK